MSTGSVQRHSVIRHSTDDMAVTRSMTVLRAALPFVRALILAGLAIILVLFGLPAVLAFAAAATL
jgi:hypothetical protein